MEMFVLGEEAKHRKESKVDTSGEVGWRVNVLASLARG